MKWKILLVLIASVSILQAGSYADPFQNTRKPGLEQIGDAVLWLAPDDIAGLDLIYGSGGRQNEPKQPFVFLEEDKSGTSPKFDIRDGNGVVWQVKLGIEAKPETAASRLVWAAGYFTYDIYFLPLMQVENMPDELSRGDELIGRDGWIHDARLKRRKEEVEKIGFWKWKDNPFQGTRELNGLRALMSLINNWDLKDINNALVILSTNGKTEKRYMVHDLGSSFSGPGRAWPEKKSKGNLENYRRSKFIADATDGNIDFVAPARPAIFYSVALPHFINRLRMRWIGDKIPRDDARWLGQVLGKLSPEQIRDAFRAAGYSHQEVEEFARVVAERILQLNHL